MLRLMRKGQSTAEYAIVIGLVIAAAVAMQIYVKRGLQAKVKLAVDYNEPIAVGNNILGQTVSGQFEPDEITTTGPGMRSKSSTVEKITTVEGGSVTRAITGTDRSERTGTQQTATIPVVP